MGLSVKDDTLVLRFSVIPTNEGTIGFDLNFRVQERYKVFIVHTLIRTPRDLESQAEDTHGVQLQECLTTLGFNNVRQLRKDKNQA